LILAANSPIFPLKNTGKTHHQCDSITFFNPGWLPFYGGRSVVLDYFLDEQQKTIRDLARRIAEERVLPVRAELDEAQEFPWQIMKDLADADMFRVFVPEEY
jgi:alkylation response protein AidB-like acyl-CoA dehydrogenase